MGDFEFFSIAAASTEKEKKKGEKKRKRGGASLLSYSNLSMLSFLLDAGGKGSEKGRRGEKGEEEEKGEIILFFSNSFSRKAIARERKERK